MGILYFKLVRFENEADDDDFDEHGLLSVDDMEAV
jgi:hypothetical protein